MTADLMTANLTPEERNSLLAAIYSECWRRGNLDFLRHATQKLMRQAFLRTDSRKFYLNCSRRLGKSHELVLNALEVCLTKRNARVLYLAPQGTDAAAIAGDLMQRILTGVDEDGEVNDFKACPEELMPKFNSQLKEYTFPSTGAVLRLKGTNGDSAKYLRGSAQHLIILDEAGIMDDLEFIISSILMPMLLTTRGRLLIATTPARTPSHYSTQLFEECSRDGAAVTFTILDAPHIPDEIKVEFLEEAGETKEAALRFLTRTGSLLTTTARREYACEFVADSNLAIFPEFDAKAKAEIVKEWERPQLFQPHVAMDPGSRDNTGILFFYLDYLAGKIVVEDEILLNNPSTAKIADEIMRKEVSLWGTNDGVLRVSDIDLRLIQDMSTMYGLQFSKARKDDSLGAINFIRHLITTRMLVIHPRCQGFIRQLTNVIWDSRGKDFWNDKEGEDKHYDLIAAAKYGFRFVNFRKSPYPRDHFVKLSPLGEFKRKSENKFNVRGNTPLSKRLAKKRR